MSLLTVENTTLRDHMVSEEQKCVDTIHSRFTGTTSPNEDDKFFGTFPYPYMNGRLHIGHAFTFMKVDAISNVQRLKGFNVLFPFGFHGTGTPIVACADKVRKELETYQEGDELTCKSQLGILEMMGVDRADFPKFVDSKFWLEYFPAVAKRDLKRFGISADLDRSFITTELNPHYDSFVKWQFKLLNEAGVLEFGKRHMIYSPDMKQPCSDHDRSVGEGVEPQEYTLIKLKLVDHPTTPINTYLLAGTLRPETMYGQTNVWVNNEGIYSLFVINGTHYIARYETYHNLIHQMENVQLVKREYIKGSDLVNHHVKAPYVTDPIPVLPMGQVSMKRGTGIVTSVPTDSPTDYLYWRAHLKTKPTLTGIIQVGDSQTYAADEIERHKVKMGNMKRLEEIHSEVYMREHNEGTLLVGKYKGELLKDAHDKIRSDLIESNDALAYYEPQSTVISRTGVECVVALTDQWYIDYGGEDVTNVVNEHIDDVMETYNAVAKTELKKASNWITKWPVSRTAEYCLGTKLPVDERFMIDSLSDSTAYFAYYTVCHLVEQIPVEHMTFKAWEYVLHNGDEPEAFSEYREIFEAMRREFSYWYPLDLRVSGRDLISNHLMMALYNHAILWKGEDMMPLAYYTNGYAMLNGQKMSKSTGNFLTLHDAIEKYSADAVRVALALAGDGMSDSNFDEKVAKSAVVFLENEMNWVLDETKFINDASFQPDYNSAEGITFTNVETSRTSSIIDYDSVFVNEVNSIINKFVVKINKINLRQAFVCVYEMVNAKDSYRNICNNTSIYSTRHRKTYCDNIRTYIRLFSTMIGVFCPFWEERLNLHINFTEEYGEAKWFKMSQVNRQNIWVRDTINEVARTTRSTLNKRMKKMKGKKSDQPLKYLLSITGYISYDQDIIDVVNVLKTYNDGYIDGNVVKEFFSNLMKHFDKKDKKKMAKIGMFSKTCFNNVEKYGSDWLDWVTSDDINSTECSSLKAYIRKVIHEINFNDVSIIFNDTATTNRAGPGNPSVSLIIS